MAKQPIRFDQRARPRRAFDARALLCTPHWEKPVPILDVSREGFRAQCDLSVSLGTVVSLEVPGIGLIPSRVIWIRDGEIGAKFLRIVDFRDCRWSGAALPSGGTAGTDEVTAERIAAARAARRA